MESGHLESGHFSLPKLKRRYTSAEVDDLLTKRNEIRTVGVAWEECAGTISTEYAYIYPPGIPLIVPGEEISKEAAQLLIKYESMGFSIEGPVGKRRIEVLING